MLSHAASLLVGLWASPMRLSSRETDVKIVLIDIVLVAIPACSNLIFIEKEYRIATG